MMEDGRRIGCMGKVSLFKKIIKIKGTLYYATGQPAYEGDWYEDKF